MAYTTRKELLDGISRNDVDSWRQFIDFYTPFVRLRAKDLRLRPQEVEELLQAIVT